MDETRTNSGQTLERKNSKIMFPFVVTLVSVLIMVVALFLPYMTAAGDMAKYIEEHPDRIEIESLGLTASDLANIPIISMGKIDAGVFGDEDGMVVNIILMVFGGFLVLTALFAILKKPIAVMIFNLLAGGVFFFFNFLTGRVYIGEDKYAWGIGYYTVMVAVVAVFVGAVWLLVTKMRLKREAQSASATNTIE